MNIFAYEVLEKEKKDENNKKGWTKYNNWKLQIQKSLKIVQLEWTVKSSPNTDKIVYCF